MWQVFWVWFSYRYLEQYFCNSFFCQRILPVVIKYFSCFNLQTQNVRRQMTYLSFYVIDEEKLLFHFEITNDRHRYVEQSVCTLSYIILENLSSKLIFEYLFFRNTLKNCASQSLSWYTSNFRTSMLFTFNKVFGTKYFVLYMWTDPITEILIQESNLQKKRKKKNCMSHLEYLIKNANQRTFTTHYS